MAELLKVGDWVYYGGQYVKILDIECTRNNAYGFAIENGKYDYRGTNFYFFWGKTIEEQEVLPKITLKHLLELPDGLSITANSKVRYCVKEILEWLSLELRPAQSELFQVQSDCVSYPKGRWP